MIAKREIPISKISWLNYSQSGIIGVFYEPENKQELVDLCRSLYKEGKQFDLIGHTSNIYFLPNYSVDIMVSTRKVRNFVESTDFIIADCGVSVRSLSLKMVDEGVKGFEGLIDLPGTVAASVYGNASCYGCSINSLMESFELLLPNGEVKMLSTVDLGLSKRSSALKRGELQGVILSVKIRKELGDKNEIKKKAEQNHIKRRLTQPPAQNNLGSIYRSSSRMTIIGYFLKAAVTLYGMAGRLMWRDKNDLAKHKKSFMLGLIGAKDLIPYFYSWNRFIWKDSEAHPLFWKFHKKHQLLFRESNFEIEIKGQR